MSYEYFEHQADIGIIGKGKTIEEAFEQAAQAMFNIMVDIKKVKPKEKIIIKADAEQLEQLFIEFLNELLAQKDIKEMVFSKFKVKINKLKVIAEAYGEKLQDKHNLKTEVKAATYSALKVEKDKNNYVVRCIVDV